MVFEMSNVAFQVKRRETQKTTNLLPYTRIVQWRVAWIVCLLIIAIQPTQFPFFFVNLLVIYSFLFA